jgi:large subunit ribosomal protein L10
MREEKQLLLDEIREKVAGSKACLFTRYQGLDPNAASDLRIKLAKVGGGFAIVRKRILMKAAEQQGISLNRDMLKGHVAVAFAMEDPISVTKTLLQFSKDHEEALEVLGGQVDGQLYTGAEVKMLSELPSQDEMRAQLLGLFEAPMAQTLSVMESLLTSVLYCLENKCEKQP